MSFIGRAPLLPVLARRGPIPSFSWDFTRVNSLPTIATFTRASTKTRFVDGLMATVASGAPAFDYHPTTLGPLGLLIEEARTNVALHNRDLTNAAWTAVDITPVKNIVGIDGAANSASRITATGANGTILQAITLASSARFQTAYVKRITGTGTVEMTTDNGTTWTAITVTSTTAWSRVSIPTQTLANPTVGFRIVTSGDAIAVDYVQNENGTFATSAIATTTASVTRAADVCSILTSAFPFNAAEGTIVVEFTDPQSGIGGSLFPGVAALSDNTNNERIIIFRDAATNYKFTVTDGGAASASLNTSSLSTDVRKIAGAYAVNDFAACGDGGSVATDTSGSLPTVDRLYIGANGAGASQLNGHIRRLSYFPRRLSNAQLQAMTA